MNNPYEGRLPPGWEAKPVSGMPNTWSLLGETGTKVTDQQIDSQFTIEIHIAYLWHRYFTKDYNSRR